MAMNIKSEEARRLAKELSALTGETMTGAVTTALRERLERVRRGKKGSLAERIMEIGRTSASRMSEETRKIDHGELLYDERGLPR